MLSTVPRGLRPSRRSLTYPGWGGAPSRHNSHPVGGPSLEASQVSAYNSQSGCQAPSLGTRFPDGGGGRWCRLLETNYKNKKQLTISCLASLFFPVGPQGSCRRKGLDLGPLRKQEHPQALMRKGEGRRRVPRGDSWGRGSLMVLTPGLPDCQGPFLQSPVT